MINIQQPFISLADTAEWKCQMLIVKSNLICFSENAIYTFFHAFDHFLHWEVNLCHST